MWNQVNCTKNHYANVGTSSPYKQWSYPMVSCPHHLPSATGQALGKGLLFDECLDRTLDK